MSNSESKLKKFKDAVVYVLPFVSVPLLNLLCIVTESTIEFFEPMQGDNLLSGAISLFCMFFLIGEAFFAFKKRDCLSLIVLGIWNLVLSFLFLFDVYAQSGIYTIYTTFELFLDRFTLIDTYELSRYDDNVAYYGAMVFSAVLGLVSVILGAVISNNEEKKEIPKKTILKFFAVSVCVFALLISTSYIASEFDTDGYFCYYSGKAYISEKTDRLYDEIKLNSDYDSVKETLKKSGYIPVSEYKKGLTPIELKFFERSSYPICDSPFDETEIFMNPDITHEYIEENGFGLIFVKKDKNNAVTEKGRGLPNRISEGWVFDNSYTDSENGVVECLKDFHSELKIGTKKEAVLERYQKDYEGTLITQTERLKGKTETEIYRFGVSGEVKKSDLPFKINWGFTPVLESVEFGSAYPDLVAELKFENGKLSGGTLYYEEYTDDTFEKEVMRTIDLKN